jgi:hypothetical protein
VVQRVHHDAAIVRPDGDEVLAPRLPLIVIAAVYVAAGCIAFSWSHSPHHLGNVAAGLALAAAAVVPRTS